MLTTKSKRRKIVKNERRRKRKVPVDEEEVKEGVKQKKIGKRMEKEEGK